MGWLENATMRNDLKEFGFDVNEKRNTVRLAGARHLKETGLLAGAHASVEIGAPGSRATATRVVAGAMLGVGLLGAFVKKDMSKVFITVETTDGQSFVSVQPAKALNRAQSFIFQFNKKFAIGAAA